MSTAKDTEEMIELFKSGRTLDEIGAKFGIKETTVRQRLYRLGFDSSPPKKYETIDKERLENLYSTKKTLREIAAEFSVCVKTIKKALYNFRIPERPPLNKIGTPAHRVAALAMVEDFESGMLWKEIAVKNGIKQHITLKRRLALLSTWTPTRRWELLLTDKGKRILEDIYIIQKLRITDLAKYFKTSEDRIARALKFHKIPKRESIVDNHINKFRRMAVGETIEVKTNAKYPITNLHEISKRIPIKISVRRCGEGIFKVTRVK